MSTFSVNQVRHLYVAKASKTTVAEGKLTQAALANKGDIQVLTDADGKLYFKYLGAGGQVRSDLIENITYAKATAAADLAYSLKKATVALSGSIDVTKNYVLRVVINQYAGMSDEDIHQIYASCTPNKEGVTNATQLYAALAKNLNANMAKEYDKLFEATSSASGIVITEVEQPWTLGIKPQVGVMFEAFLVDDDGVAGTTTYAASGSTVGNGKKIADMEYFYMGERGDNYRNVGWPNSIPTEYLVDSSKAYNVLDIHYSYVGPNEGPQKSEKDITIVAETTAILNAVITAINTATGSTIATL